MIVRTYGRRNRCISRSFSESSFNGEMEDNFQDSLSQESSQDVFSFTFSSQDSSPWSLDSEIHGSSSNREPDSQSLLPPRPGGPRNSSQGNKIRNSNKSKNGARQPGVFKKPNSGELRVARTMSGPATSTLMEAQEFGEMMEHVDEVNFALDGLRPGQPSRVRRASLLSLLSICVTAQQRRLLRAQGMAKTIIDAILGLTFDDSPSTLAAAALFFVLASDGQDEYLLDTPSCIRFLLKLLNPPTADEVENKVPNISSKLLSLCRDPVLKGTIKQLDSGSTAIVSKVQEILLSFKEMEPRNYENIERPELSSKWIALLTMEKACLSTISLEDTTGTVRKAGGKFKERLRELGGLDAVVTVASDCHRIMEGWFNHRESASQNLKDDAVFHSLVLLLKCLKIMENATFLSKDNQDHLLEMNAKVGSRGCGISFVGLVISAIKILSALSLLYNSSDASSDKKPQSHCGGADTQLLHVSDVKLNRGGMDESLSNGKRCSAQMASLRDDFPFSTKRQSLSTSRLEFSCGSVTSSTSASDIQSTVEGAKSFSPFSSNGMLRRSNGANHTSTITRIELVGCSERHSGCEDHKQVSLDDSQDPFAFDEDELKPSKWELLSMKETSSRAQRSRKQVPEFGPLIDVYQITSSDSIHETHSFETSSLSTVEEHESNLPGDCLLTAVKVLMNLTNDNPVGCQQIASCGGLDAMGALIVDHFPIFDSCLSADSQAKGKLPSQAKSTIHGHQSKDHLQDQELDFLVAILGLLVNLVEKDSQNRSKLVAASVPCPRTGNKEVSKSPRELVPLLCSIFLANQGAGDTAGEGKQLPWDDESTLLQGEREAENMIVEAYAALLLAFLSTESAEVRDAIASCLPDHDLEVLVPVLERFLAFHVTLNMISPETHAAVTKVIESCRGS